MDAKQASVKPKEGACVVCKRITPGYCFTCGIFMCPTCNAHELHTGCFICAYCKNVRCNTHIVSDVAINICYYCHIASMTSTLNKIVPNFGTLAHTAFIKTVTASEAEAEAKNMHDDLSAGADCNRAQISPDRTDINNNNE